MAGRRSARTRRRRPPEHALVADAAGHAVGVEALEQQLRRAPRAFEQVTEAGERDRPGALAFGDQSPLRLVVGGAADREPVAEPDEAALLLEIDGEGRVLDCDRLEAGQLELGLELR